MISMIRPSYETSVGADSLLLVTRVAETHCCMEGRVSDSVHLTGCRTWRVEREVNVSLGRSVAAATLTCQN